MGRVCMCGDEKHGNNNRCRTGKAQMEEKTGIKTKTQRVELRKRKSDCYYACLLMAVLPKLLLLSAQRKSVLYTF